MVVRRSPGEEEEKEGEEEQEQLLVVMPACLWVVPLLLQGGVLRSGAGSNTDMPTCVRRSPRSAQHSNTKRDDTASAATRGSASKGRCGPFAMASRAMCSYGGSELELFPWAVITSSRVHPTGSAVSAGGAFSGTRGGGSLLSLTNRECEGSNVSLCVCRRWGVGWERGS